MDRKDLIKRYIDFFKLRSHKEIANASLIPENDPTVLFTTAGMHPLVPYLSGERHPLGKRLVNVQKCIRTKDIEKVGNETHHTFFEMLGNWSLGDYWKKDAIKYSFEFLTKKLGIKKGDISVSCFLGDGKIEKDNESSDIWRSLGVKKIKFLGRKDNWWGPAGKTGPCGPDSEMFVDGVEIWNDVFMEYEKDEKGYYKKAKQKNVDTGMGVERTVAILNGLKDNYLADMWMPIIEKIELVSKHDYDEDKSVQRSMRIIADHIKAAVFIINDGIVPSNSEQGYVLRRLIRRAIRYGRVLGMEKFINKIADAVYEIYGDYNLDKKKIYVELMKEEEKFLKTIEQGLRIFEKLAVNKKLIDGKNAFLLYQSYGFPIEMTEELSKERKIRIDKGGFEKEFNKHKKLSQTASVGRFKSGLADHSEKTRRLHTATHLLNEALRIVLKDDKIYQKGSNITPERTRFDFNFDRKLTSEEVKKIEMLVNKKIREGILVKRKEMSLDDARKLGAQGIFDEKYGDKVSVYSIGDFSRELCTGPHVENTKDIGSFKIVKQESVGSGVRRIKGAVE